MGILLITLHPLIQHPLAPQVQVQMDYLQREVEEEAQAVTAVAL